MFLWDGSSGLFARAARQLTSPSSTRNVTCLFSLLRFPLRSTPNQQPLPPFMECAESRGHTTASLPAAVPCAAAAAAAVPCRAQYNTRAPLRPSASLPLSCTKDTAPRGEAYFPHVLFILGNKQNR